MFSALILLAYLYAPDFAAYCLGQFFYKFYYPGILIGRSSVLDVLLQFLYKLVAGGIAF